MQITSRQAVAPDVQFTRDAGRYWIAILVKNVDLSVGDRSSNRHTCGKRSGVFDVRESSADSRFSWAIVVDDAALRFEFVELFEQIERERLAAEDQTGSRQDSVSD